MDLEVVLVLFVILEDQVGIIIIVAHVGEHLEDLFKGSLRGRVLTDSQLFLLVLYQSKQEAN